MFVTTRCLFESSEPQVKRAFSIFCYHRSQWHQVIFIRLLERIVIRFPLLLSQYRRGKACLHELDVHQQPCQPSIPISERVYEDEFVVDFCSNFYGLNTFGFFAFRSGSMSRMRSLRLIDIADFEA